MFLKIIIKRDVQFPTYYVDLVRGGGTTKHGLHQQGVNAQFESEEKGKKKKMVREIKQTVIPMRASAFSEQPSNQVRFSGK